MVTIWFVLGLLNSDGDVFLHVLVVDVVVVLDEDELELLVGGFVLQLEVCENDKIDTDSVKIRKKINFFIS